MSKSSPAGPAPTHTDLDMTQLFPARAVTAALLSLGVLAGLNACAKNAGSGAAGSRKVAFVVANTELNFSKEMAAGFSSGVDQVGGVEHEVVGPAIVDGPKQLQMFQSLTKNVSGGIAVATLSPEIFAAPMAAAVQDGIPVVAVDSPPLASSAVTLYVGNDNYELGKLLADQVIAQLPAGAGGKIVIGTSSPGVPVLDRRVKGVRDEIKAKLPGVTTFGPFDTKQDVGANLAAWRTLVKVNPTALAFIGTGDADGWNLATIRRGTHGTWRAGAFDLDPKSLDAVRSGDLVLVSPEHFIKGAVTGRLEARHAKDGTALPKGWICTPGLAVTKANVDAVIARQATAATRTAALATEVDRILADSGAVRPLRAAG
jgi:ribose transport system substrate-binding protein